MQTNSDKLKIISELIDGFTQNQEHGIICLSCLDGKVSINYASDNILMAETIATCMIREPRFRAIITDAIKLYMTVCNNSDITFNPDEILNNIITQIKNQNENGTN